MRRAPQLHIGELTMRVVVVLTHAPLQGAHFQEAERAAMMFSGLGHAVDFVLMDDAVLSMLVGSGYSFGLRQLSRISGIEGLSTYFLSSSASRLNVKTSVPGFRPLPDEQFASMLQEARVVVF